MRVVISKQLSFHGLLVYSRFTPILYFFFCMLQSLIYNWREEEYMEYLKQNKIERDYK
jgi:hypothetical protein